MMRILQETLSVMLEETSDDAHGHHFYPEYQEYLYQVSWQIIGHEQILIYNENVNL